MGYAIPQGQTAQPLCFFLAATSDGATGVTGLSPTVQISKNGAAFASPAGAVSEIGSGWYKVAGNATDSATLGPLLLRATGTGALPCNDQFVVVAYDPQNAALGSGIEMTEPTRVLDVTPDEYTQVALAGDVLSLTALGTGIYFLTVATPSSAPAGEEYGTYLGRQETWPETITLTGVDLYVRSAGPACKVALNGTLALLN